MQQPHATAATELTWSKDRVLDDVVRRLLSSGTGHPGWTRPVAPGRPCPYHEPWPTGQRCLTLDRCEVTDPCRNSSWCFTAAPV
jgi:hypothetical protein